MDSFFAGNGQKPSADLLKQLAHNEKMAELGRISAGVVHELNAPLSVISSASQMILREEGVPESVREMVARIDSEAQRLSQLARGLLNFSSRQETSSEVDVNLTIGFLLDFLRYEASRRGVVVRRELDFSLPAIKLDGNLLKQILLNIIMNALQAMEDQGGELLLRTMVSGADRLCVIIRDNGPGIPPEVLENIFTPYFTTKEIGEGTGLGLFVSRQLVEELGGRIEVSSSVGKGAEFTVTLPLQEKPEE
ncbi:two-component sensor histidine kinase [Geobacter sp. SVR]|nr:two-component sensor histidine kinase [Geobacter sp. SVR]GCF86605.1 two-component sensor histidine kinase [Geobacter sp. SVR]